MGKAERKALEELEIERIQLLLNRVKDAFNELHEQYGATILLSLSIDDKKYSAIHGRGIVIAENLAAMMTEDETLRKFIKLSLQAYNVYKDK